MQIPILQYALGIYFFDNADAVATVKSILSDSSDNLSWRADSLCLNRVAILSHEACLCDVLSWLGQGHDDVLKP